MNSTAANSGKTETNRKLANKNNDTVPTVSLLLPEGEKVKGNFDSVLRSDERSTPCFKEAMSIQGWATSN